MEGHWLDRTGKLERGGIWYVSRFFGTVVFVSFFYLPKEADRLT